jgi:hypothetical protein
MNLKAQQQRGLQLGQRGGPGSMQRGLRQTLASLSIMAALVAVPAASAQLAPPLVRARVQGVVFDSTTMYPLSGALVQLVLATDPSRVRTMTAGADGAFRFDTVAAGSYLLGFLHARLDSVAFGAPLLRVDVRDTTAIEAMLAIPSQRSMVARTCGPNAARDSTGLFAGSVRTAAGAPLQGRGYVRVQWAEILIGPRGLERRTPSVRAETDDTGQFAVCGIPVGSLMMTRAMAGPDSSGYAEFELPGNGYLHRTLYVSNPQRVTSGDTSRPSLTVMRGPGSIRGTIRSAAGAPIPGARVSVWGTGLETTTDARGEFRLATLPMGTFTMEVRALGFELLRRPVDILPSDAATVVALAPVSRLDTVRVTATRPSPGLAAFEARRKRGFGYFLDEAAIEKRQALAMSDLLRTTPGVSVSPGMFGDQVMMRGSGGFCSPTIFLDGTRIMNEDGNLDGFINPQDVRAIEVYTRGSSVPAELQSLNGCGVIAIWTGARGR